MNNVFYAALRCLVNDRRFVGLPMVIETPKERDAADSINLAILRALAGTRRVGERARRLAEQPFGNAGAGLRRR